jgi:DNA-binding XRE family transcriptional regulator
MALADQTDSVGPPAGHLGTSGLVTWNTFWARHLKTENPMAQEEFAHRIEVLFGRNLRAARLRAGLTRREVAARAGIAVTSLIQIESGTTDPDLCLVWMLAEVVGRAASDLLT